LRATLAIAGIAVVNKAMMQEAANLQFLDFIVSPNL
jgi:hypothetical protein